MIEGQSGSFKLWPSTHLIKKNRSGAHRDAKTQTVTKGERPVNKTHLPWCLLIFIFLETLPMFLGPLGALTLPGFIGGPDSDSIVFGAYLYSWRNLAVGVAFILATLLRNAPMLFALILVRLVTDIGDFPTLVAFGKSQNPLLLGSIFVFLYYIPAIIALRYLWQQMTGTPAEPAQS